MTAEPIYYQPIPRGKPIPCCPRCYNGLPFCVCEADDDGD